MALPDVKSRLCGPSDLKRLLSERPELKAELEEREEKYRVGLWRWRPRFLQVFRNAVTMTVLLFAFATLEGSLVSGEHLHLTLAAPLVTVDRGGDGAIVHMRACCADQCGAN